MGPHIYTPSRCTSASVDTNHCRASVLVGFTYAQCSKRGTKSWIDPDTGEKYLFCGTHHPDRAARHDAFTAKLAESRRRTERSELREQLANAAIEAFQTCNVSPPVFSARMHELAEQLIADAQGEETQT